MDLGFEAAKGATDKVLGVKLPVFMRLILPGLLASAVVYPAVPAILRRLPISQESGWEKIAAYGIFVFLLGALISTTNSEVYKIYEGRTFWPQRLRRWACERQQARVSRLLKAADAAKAARRLAEYDERWYDLRAYPINKLGVPEATHPTRIGNLLAGYEDYPDKRYGMDSVFYWPRIWIQMEKETKEEIDSQWSTADGLLMLSAISFAGSILWMLRAATAELTVDFFGLPFGAPGLALLGGIGWAFLGFLWYRLSLPFHRKNGEVFKSIFDVYRDKVWNMTALKPHEKEMWDAAWAYLQYQQLRCPNCPAWPRDGVEQCPKCGFGLLEMKKGLRESGKFPTR